VNLDEAEETHWRVADPDWEDPFEGAYSMRLGQRWNAKGSFPIAYLNANEETANANARLMVERVATLGVDIDDLEEGELPILIPCVVPARTVLDAVSDAGCVDVGLPQSYPFELSGGVVPHATCQPIGEAAWQGGLDGIACRSAALLTDAGRELAWFDRPGKRLTSSGPGVRYSE